MIMPEMFFFIEEIILRHVQLELSPIISLDTKLTEDLGFDSLNFIDLMTDVEKEFNINISHEEIEDIQTVDDLTNLVYNKLSEK